MAGGAGSRGAGTGISLPTVLDRVTEAAARRTTPLRALAALLATLAVTAAALTLVAPLQSGPPAGVPGLRWMAGVAAQSPAPEPPPHQPPMPGATAPAVSPPAGDGVPGADFIGWAVLDRGTGAITGSGNLAATSTTASMIKAWLVADYLRRTYEAGDEPDPARLDQLRLIIRDSNNQHTQTIFQELGAHESIERLIGICGLTDSSADPGRWSTTRLSARDTARMGACIADGAAAGPGWTGWLLDEMRAVRGLGDFGVAGE